MPAYTVVIETPSGSRVRKGVIAENEENAVAGIRRLQGEKDAKGIRRCQAGEIIDVFPRPKGKPIPPRVMSSPDAVAILSAIGF